MVVTNVPLFAGMWLKRYLGAAIGYKRRTFNHPLNGYFNKLLLAVSVFQRNPLSNIICN